MPPDKEIKMTAVTPSTEQIEDTVVKSGYFSRAEFRRWLEKMQNDTSKEHPETSGPLNELGEIARRAKISSELERRDKDPRTVSATQVWIAAKSLADFNLDGANVEAYIEPLIEALRAAWITVDDEEFIEGGFVLLNPQFQDDYTPSDEEVQKRYWLAGTVWDESNKLVRDIKPVRDAQFLRWLKEIKAKAWDEGKLAAYPLEFAVEQFIDNGGDNWGNLDDPYERATTATNPYQTLAGEDE